jgi:hypothetical protein
VKAEKFTEGSNADRHRRSLIYDLAKEDSESRWVLQARLLRLEERMQNKKWRKQSIQELNDLLVHKKADDALRAKYMHS